MRVALMAAAICAVCMSISASAQIAGYVGGNNGKFVGSIGLIGGGSAPTGCTGAVDLSAGCALPMLHGVP